GFTGMEQAEPVVREVGKVTADRFIRAAAVEKHADAAGCGLLRDVETDQDVQRIERLVLVPEHAIQLVPEILGTESGEMPGGARLNDGVPDVAALVKFR